MKSKSFILLTVLLIFGNSSLIYSKTLSSDTNANRSSKWAVKMVGASIDDLPNFHKVSDVLYRGAQPTEAGIKQLKKIGVKTIINLRSFNSDRGEINRTDINYIHLYVKAWHIEEKEIIKFLKTVSDTALTPVFVHCQHGADRTGTMCAIYRIFKENWTKKEAIDEMVNGGFGYHTIWKNLIKFINNLDVEKIRKKLE